MSKFKKGDNALFVTPHELTPVTVISTTGENLQPPYCEKYPIAAVTAQGDVYNFTDEGRNLVTDALPRLFPIPSGMVFADAAPAAPECKTSFILSEVIGDLKRREQVGIKKYGTTVDRSDLSTEQWVQHFYEELLDGAVYARAILQNVRE
jgi:hypothetical protein